MIHSLAGGEIREKEYFTFVWVEIIGPTNIGEKYWYISPLKTIEEGAQVELPLGQNNSRKIGRVIRVVKNVSRDRAPFPVNRTKEIFKVIS